MDLVVLPQAFSSLALDRLSLRSRALLCRQSSSFASVFQGNVLSLLLVPIIVSRS